MVGLESSVQFCSVMAFVGCFVWRRWINGVPFK